MFGTEIAFGNRKITELTFEKKNIKRCAHKKNLIYFQIEFFAKKTR
jgi:hypothetical protein